MYASLLQNIGRHHQNLARNGDHISCVCVYIVRKPWQKQLQRNLDSLEVYSTATRADPAYGQTLVVPPQLGPGRSGCGWQWRPTESLALTARELIYLRVSGPISRGGVMKCQSTFLHLRLMASSPRAIRPKASATSRSSSTMDMRRDVSSDVQAKPDRSSSFCMSGSNSMSKLKTACRRSLIDRRRTLGG